VSSTAGSLTTPCPGDLQGTFAALCRARGPRRGDGSLVAQPRSGTARRTHFSAAAFTNVNPRSSRLPRHHGAVPRRQASPARPARARAPRGGEPGRPGVGRNPAGRLDRHLWSRPVG
jgi:hypothetical protein